MPSALLIKAFTQNPNLGNPAGVILDAEGLSEGQMIAIADELGFSESAFVFPSDEATVQVRFFTPTKEVPLCGHATIATFYALWKSGRFHLSDGERDIFTQKTSAGILEVEIDRTGLITMTQSAPVFYDYHISRAEVAELLGLDEHELGDLPIELVSTGSPKLIVPVKSLAILQKIQPNLEKMKALCANSEVRGFYPFTQETMENSDFHARQFNPFAGIDEDPVTGVAAGALGAYAVKHQVFPKHQFVIEQGYVLNKGGKMSVNVEGEVVKVGGYAVQFGEKSVE